MADFADLTLKTAIALASETDDVSLQRTLASRLSSIATDQDTFKTWCDRFDGLYFTTSLGPWGFDLWPDDESAKTPGRSHVSVNTPHIYVDIPATMTAVEPVENMEATEDSDKARTAANALERIRKAWKIEEQWQLKRHKAATVKGLYGRTAAYVYYDRDEKRPCAKIVENPRNLYLGYKSDSHDEMEWAARVEHMDPMACVERFSVTFTARSGPDGRTIPWVTGASTEEPHPEFNFGPAKVEVWDYWYRVPKKVGKRGETTKMETWNAVVVGNEVVRNFKYDEYEGAIPYIPLFNTYIPGVPTGRSELHDLEVLIREKMARITAGAQMIAGATSGDYWQLVGPDAPSRVPPSAKPKRNEVAAPGAGNRIEAIAPFVAQFQLEQFLGRIDREMATVSGLNDLLLGLAPAQVLNSSKAINALVANYESRISMRRLLFYTWDRATWNLVVKVWQKKDSRVADVMKAGGGTLDIQDSSLAPKDDMETATRALNLMNGKLWSQARAMGAVGVEDPEQEQNIIREERADAVMFPADVEVMAQLMGALSSLGLGTPQNAQSQMGGQASSGMDALRQALGGATPQNTVGSQGEGMQGMTPPIPGAGPSAGGEQPFAQAMGGPQAMQMQSVIQGGQSKGRIMTTQQLGRR